MKHLRRTDTPTLFLTGTAGSGKSTLAGALASWLPKHDIRAVTVNLDPGAESLPYEPDLDVRQWIRLDQVMKDHGLGPNGAQVAAADMIALQLDRLLHELEPMSTDVIVVDTPGQLELFAFRSSGPVLTTNLSTRPVVAFLMDPHVASTPRGFASQVLLGATVVFRLGVPTINVLSKVDQLDEEARARVEAWSEDPERLAEGFLADAPTMENQLYQTLSRTLADLWGVSPLVSTSATTTEGFDRLVGTLLEAAGAE